MQNHIVAKSIFSIVSGELVGDVSKPVLDTISVVDAGGIDVVDECLNLPCSHIGTCVITEAQIRGLGYFDCGCPLLLLVLLNLEGGAQQDKEGE